MKCRFKNYSLFLFTTTLICLIVSLSGLHVNSDILPDPSNFYIVDEDPNNVFKQWNVQVAASSTNYLCVWDNGFDILGRSFIPDTQCCPDMDRSG